MDTPYLGQEVSNGEAVVVAGRQKRGTDKWYVLAMRKDSRGALHPYVVWLYAGDGSVDDGDYCKDLLEAFALLEGRAGYNFVYDYDPD